MVDTATLQKALPDCLAETDLPTLGSKYEGKVRDNYTRDGRRYIVVTDRISAFDRVLGTVPFKGQVLNRLAAWWFDKTRKVVPNHVIGVPDPNVLECVECEPILVEMVVRAYATGTTSTSLWTHYEKGARVFCGHELPDGLKKHQKLPAPILTPTTKAPKGEHDVSGSREEILATGMVTAKDFDEAAGQAMRLFAAGQAICAERGLILVDTKYEFGRTPDGRLVVIDEVHTPDSSRFWRSSTYEERFVAGQDPDPLDKDFVRRWYIGQGYKGDGVAPPMPDEVRVGAAERYIAAYEQITGEAFVPDTEPPMARMKRNLESGGSR
ncbi:MAG TPA: phosphoribosylaminoimidazolesuccinocarboxamide synthase [Polyangiaceae bacterium]|jgi:phosphoribosylaminoimidazole-succinocarboxamide synthase|nr:phosphoribosylaminoimidazolesuccinocarboxamide synthase [Polyangiaceae bacterium]